MFLKNTSVLCTKWRAQSAQVAPLWFSHKLNLYQNEVNPLSADPRGADATGEINSIIIVQLFRCHIAGKAISSEAPIRNMITYILHYITTTPSSSQFRIAVNWLQLGETSPVATFGCQDKHEGDQTPLGTLCVHPLKKTARLGSKTILILFYLVVYRHAHSFCFNNQSTGIIPSEMSDYTWVNQSVYLILLYVISHL